jgi:hypothetical protein
MWKEETTKANIIVLDRYWDRKDSTWSPGDPKWSLYIHTQQDYTNRYDMRQHGKSITNYK